MEQFTVVGIDVSKDRLDVHVLPAGEAWSVSRDGEGLGELCRRLGGAARLVALEATGGYETIVAATLSSEGVPVVVVNPAQVRHFANALGQRAKTDPIDARVIARFAEATRPQIRPLPDRATRLLADLVARRRQIIEMIVAERQRLHRTCAGAQEHRAVVEGAGEGTCQRRPRHRRQRAQLAGVAREGRPDDIGSKRWPDHRQNHIGRAARVGHARPQADRGPCRAGSVHPPVRCLEGQGLDRRWAQCRAHRALHGSPGCQALEPGVEGLL